MARTTDSSAVGRGSARTRTGVPPPRWRSARPSGSLTRTGVDGSSWDPRRPMHTSTRTSVLPKGRHVFPTKASTRSGHQRGRRLERNTLSDPPSSTSRSGTRLSTWTVRAPASTQTSAPMVTKASPHPAAKSASDGSTSPATTRATASSMSAAGRVMSTGPRAAPPRRPSVRRRHPPKRPAACG